MPFLPNLQIPGEYKWLHDDTNTRQGKLGKTLNDLPEKRKNSFRWPQTSSQTLTVRRQVLRWAWGDRYCVAIRQDVNAPAQRLRLVVDVRVDPTYLWLWSRDRKQPVSGCNHAGWELLSLVRSRGWEQHLSLIVTMSFASTTAGCTNLSIIFHASPNEFWKTILSNHKSSKIISHNTFVTVLRKRSWLQYLFFLVVYTSRFDGFSWFCVDLVVYRCPSPLLFRRARLVAGGHRHLHHYLAVSQSFSVL